MAGDRIECAAVGLGRGGLAGEGLWWDQFITGPVRPLVVLFLCRGDHAGPTKDIPVSGTTAPTEAQIALASYDRMLAETGKQLAETRKFVAEQNKLADEALKLRSEARKFDRERWVVLAGGIGGIVAAITGIASLLKLMGRL